MIFLNLDIGDILDMKESFQPKVDEVLRQAVSDLTRQTHGHILEEVNKKLHSTREKYLQALSPPMQVEKDIWVIELDASANWIEEGIPPNTSMLKGLLSSPKAKTAKDGSKYIVVPFQHNKGPTQSTPAQISLTETIKAEMKKRQIPYGKIEKDTLGNPKTGLLHSFDIKNKPLKTAEGVGQGHGPIGSVKQGATGIPFLQGIRVYQKHIVDPKTNKKTTAKQIMTFRVASSKNPDAFIHPGLTPKRFLDEAAKWAYDQFDNLIRDQVILSIVGG
jgi:hypothetical protein